MIFYSAYTYIFSATYSYRNRIVASRSETSLDGRRLKKKSRVEYCADENMSATPTKGYSQGWSTVPMKTCPLLQQKAKLKKNEFILRRTFQSQQ